MKRKITTKKDGLMCLSSDITPHTLTPSLTSCTGMRASGRPRAAVRKILGREREGGRKGRKVGW